MLNYQLLYTSRASWKDNLLIDWVLHIRFTISQSEAFSTVLSLYPTILSSYWLLGLKFLSHFGYGDYIHVLVLGPFWYTLAALGLFSLVWVMARSNHYTKLKPNLSDMPQLWLGIFQRVLYITSKLLEILVEMVRSVSQFLPTRKFGIESRAGQLILVRIYCNQNSPFYFWETGSLS